MFEWAGERNSNNKNHQFWRQDNHPIELTTNELINQRLDHIHNNPVEAGFVLELELWHWGSARDYIKNEKGYVNLFYV